MKKWLIGSTLSILLIVIIGAALLLSRRRHPSIPPLITATRGTLTETATAAGNIVPKKIITIKSDVSGIAKTISAHAGDAISPHELLVQIQQNKPPEQQAELISEFKQAKAEKINAAQQLANYTELLKHKLITSHYNDYILAQKNYDTQSITYELKKQQLDLYQHGETMVNGKRIKSEVTSPVQGYILQRFINTGDSINAMGENQPATPLFTVADMHDLIFRGSVDEAYAAQIKIGAPAIITIAALPNIKIAGQITSVALQSDQENQVSSASKDAANASANSPFNVGFQIEIGKLKIPKHLRLLSGYSATATITLKTATHVLIIPSRVLMDHHHQMAVRLYEGPRQKTKIVPVTLGITQADQVVVTHGLSEQDRIIDISALPTDSD